MDEQELSLQTCNDCPVNDPSVLLECRDGVTRCAHHANLAGWCWGCGDREPAWCEDSDDERHGLCYDCQSENEMWYRRHSQIR